MRRAKGTMIGTLMVLMASLSAELDSADLSETNSCDQGIPIPKFVLEAIKVTGDGKRVQQPMPGPPVSAHDFGVWVDDIVELEPGEAKTWHSGYVASAGVV